MSEEKNGSILRLLKRIAKTKVAGQTLTELERLVTALNMDEKELLRLYVDSKNTACKDRFMSTPFQNRVLLLPQCLRSKDCPAKLGEYGYECEMCGKCGLQEVIEDASKLGYKTFILPGGTIVERIFRDFKPRGCIGVACLKEIVLGIFVSERNGIVPIGVPLLKEGCVGTVVDWVAVKAAIHMSLRQL